MTNAHKLTAALAAALCLFLICAGYGWVQEREARIVVGAQVQADKEAQAKIDASEAANTAALKQALAASVSVKQATQTPAQIVKEIPVYLPSLPQPIRQETAADAAAAKAANLPNAPQAGDLVIPGVSAKAFFDSQVDCRDNSTKLQSCQVTLRNDAESASIDKAEIHQLQTALKGGTKWHRTKAALKYIGIGAAIGAGAAAYSLH